MSFPFKVSKKSNGSSAEALEVVREQGRKPSFLVALEDGSFDEWAIQDVVKGSLSKKEVENLNTNEGDETGVEDPASETEAPREVDKDVVTDGTIDPNGPEVPRKARRKVNPADLDAVITDNVNKGLGDEETASGEEKSS